MGDRTQNLHCGKACLALEQGRHGAEGELEGRTCGNGMKADTCIFMGGEGGSCFIRVLESSTLTGDLRKPGLSQTEARQAIPADPHQQPENQPHPARQIGDRHKAQPASSQPWVAETAALEKMMCLFRETKCPTMNRIRFHRHMKTRSILSTLCKPRPQMNISFCLSSQSRIASSSQDLPRRRGHVSP